MKTLTAVILAVAGMYFAAAIHYGKAHAQDVHQQAGPSLVYLKASGQTKSEPPKDVETSGTGFLVSTDGLVLTTHHLISELRDVDPKTVGIEASIAEKSADVRPAAVVDAAINTDLLLLKLPPGPDDYVPVSLGNAYKHDDAQDIYTSGFSEQLTSPKRDRGQIGAREAPDPYGYLWSTSMKFEDGQRGSPIYDDKGDVIGILTSLEPEAVHMIPIEFADALLAQVRLREIKAEMQEFDTLRNRMDWSGEYVKVSNLRRGTVQIRYEKMMPGNPHVASIDVLVEAEGMKGGEWHRTEKPFEKPELEPLSQPTDKSTSAVFEIPEDLVKEIFDYAIDADYTQIDRFIINIVPHLTDGTIMDKKRITVEART